MEPPAPLVSVIIATYRAGDYLRQAVASVLAQSCGDFEVLVADDGQDDATRLLYERNPITLGPAGNHWAALRRARGEYLAILNHDDLWQPDFLRRMLAGFAEDPRVVVAFCDHDVIDPAGTLLPTRTGEHSERTGRAGLTAGVHCPFPALAVSCMVPAAQAAVFKKSTLDLPGLPEIAGPAYDLWLNYLLARGGGGAYYLPERLASWRTHPASISMNPTRSDWSAGAGACFVDMAAHPLFAAFRGTLNRQAASCFASAALASLRGGRLPEARQYSLQAFRQHPGGARTFAVLGLTRLPRFLQRVFLKA